MHNANLERDFFSLSLLVQRSDSHHHPEATGGAVWREGIRALRLRVWHEHGSSGQWPSVCEEEHPR